MLTPEEEVIRDSIMHPDGEPQYEFSTVDINGFFIDFFVTTEHVYERIYNSDRTEFQEILIAKEV